MDLFAETLENYNEVIPNTKFSNPIKNFYFNYIKRQNPYSLEAVNDLLKKFKDNASLIKGNSNIILKKIDMSKIDYVFLDGGHDYQTVKNDLDCCREVVINGGTVLCDDYDLSHAPGVKKAIDESGKGKLCVMLLPVSTSTVLFHDFIQPNADEIRFIKGRVRFIGINTFGEKVTNKAGMHDSMIVVFKGKKG